MTCEAVCQRIKLDLFDRLTEAADVKYIFIHIAFDFAVGAHYLDVAVAVVSKGADGKGGSCAAFKLHVDRLVVGNVIVAVIYASAVGSFLHGLVEVFSCRVVCQYGERPAVIAAV